MLTEVVGGGFERQKRHVEGAPPGGGGWFVLEKSSIRMCCIFHTMHTVSFTNVYI